MIEPDVPRAGGRPRGWRTFLVALSFVWGVAPNSVEGQHIRGRVIDSTNGAAVRLAGVFLLDAEREPVEGSAADTTGFYTITAPQPGEYYLFVQRLGYFENETPLLAVGPDGTYEVDIEMRPEPFRLDPLEVTVRNEELERYLTLEFGVNPNSIFGYRAVQGIRLEEAKLKAHDNTDLLRWLYIPVSHGIQVCVGSMWLGHPKRASGSEGGERLCGSLMLDGYAVPNEHIESIAMDRIAVVVTVPGQVRLYTREFDWTFKPGG